MPRSNQSENTIRYVAVLAAMLASVALHPTGAIAGTVGPTPVPFEIPWHSIDGGGGSASRESTATLLLIQASAFGQPDANRTISDGTANQYSIHGGGYVLPSFASSEVYPDPALPPDGEYLDGTTHTLCLSGPAGLEVRVYGYLHNDHEPNVFLVGSGTLSADACTSIVLGGPTSAVGPLPDEAVIDLRVEWRSGEKVVLAKNYPNRRVDVIPPRFVHALAPAGDFWASLPQPSDDFSCRPYSLDSSARENGSVLAPDHSDAVQAFKAKYYPERATTVEFYGTNAVDFGAEGLGNPDDLEYSIKIRRPETEQTTGVAHQTAWTTSTLPISSFAVSDVENLETGTLVRGAFPKNVISGIPSAHVGEGEYRWRVCVRDRAGNFSESSESELWIPWYNEPLAFNLYTDGIHRFRLGVWIPKDHYVPKHPTESTKLNAEWNPYSVDAREPLPATAGGTPDLIYDSSLAGAEAILEDAAESYSPLVFRGDDVPAGWPQDKRRNQQYAEYMWTASRRWQSLVDWYGEEVEQELRLPLGVGYIGAYQEVHESPLGAARARMNYSRLASDGRMRVDLYRDPYITTHALNRNSVSVPLYLQFQANGLQGRIGALYNGSDTALNWGLGLRRFFKNNSLAESAEVGGYTFKWYVAGAARLSRKARKFERVPLLENYMGWLSQRGGGSLDRSQGLGGVGGTMFSKGLGWIDPLECAKFGGVQDHNAFYAKRATTAAYANEFFSSDQRYVQDFMLVQGTDLEEHERFPISFTRLDGSNGRDTDLPEVPDMSIIGEYTAIEQFVPVIKRGYSSFEHIDGRSLPTQRLQGSVPRLFGSIRTQSASTVNRGVGYCSSEEAGNFAHEFGHAVGSGHGYTIGVKGPAYGPNQFIFRDSTGFGKIGGNLQMRGVDPFGEASSYACPLLGVPEYDVRLGPEYILDQNSPSTIYPNFKASLATTACHPAEMWLVASHPIFRATSSPQQADPIVQVAWPRDCAYIDPPLAGSANDNRYDFPPIVLSGHDATGGQLAGALCTIFNWAYLNSRNSPAVIDTPILGSNVKPLYVFPAAAFGYRDVAEGASTNYMVGFLNRISAYDYGPTFLYPQTVTIASNSPDKFGRIGLSGRGSIVITHDLSSYRTLSASLPPHDLRYIKATNIGEISGAYGSLNPSTAPLDTILATFDGSASKPYPELRYALVVEGRRPLQSGLTDREKAQDKGSTFVLMTDHASTTTLHYTHPIENPRQLLTQAGASPTPTIDLTIVGSGSSPGEVVLKLLDVGDYSYASTSRDLFRMGESADVTHLSIGNMTLDGRGSAGGATATRGIYVETADFCAFGGLVIRNMQTAGIEIKTVLRRLRITNNTIYQCNKGIVIGRVGSTESDLNNDYRVFHMSCVENNIVLNYSSAGIAIGSNETLSSPPTTAQLELRCEAWNPFGTEAGSNRNQLDAGSSQCRPNPYGPVRNNWVWRDSGNRDGAFTGVTWYATAYDISFEERQMEERFEDPGVAATLALTATSAARGKGSAFRIDAVRKGAGGKWWGMRRSPGAYASSNVGDYNVPLE